VSLTQTPGLVLDSYPLVLEQVLLQWLDNALVHGVGSGGALRIDAALDAHTGQLALALSDNGSGMAAPVLGRVFEPFFTTRMGQGNTGLGLHIVHNLVTNVLGGTIEVRSDSAGTCFTVRFPCIAPVLASHPPIPDLPLP
jgi:signal transduction histidine kinase